MGTHAARLLKPGRHPHVTPDARGTTCDGVTMTSGLPPGLPDGPSDAARGRLGAVDRADRTDQTVNSSLFRSVLGRFATGVVAITAIDPGSGEPCGLAANSFTSVSLDPPLVAFCVAHTSTSWPRLRASAIQTINVLAEHQQAVCAALASRGGEKFADLTWTCSPAGNPVIDDVLAWIDCSVEAEYPAGDHVIVVARVHRLEVHGDGGPLLFFRGGYGRFQS